MSDRRALLAEPGVPQQRAELGPLGVTASNSSGGSGSGAGAGAGGGGSSKKKKNQSGQSAAASGGSGGGSGGGGGGGSVGIPVGYVRQAEAGGFPGHAEPGRDYLNPLGKLPHHIVWACSYPRYNPAMFGSQNDGDNVTVHAIFQITEATARESMLPDDQQSNAVKLARRWAHNCGHGDEASCRSEANRAPWTKAIVRKVNGGLPMGVNQFNGKPAIQYTNTFRKWHNATTLECQHTMHMCLPYPIKKILFYNRELTQNWVSVLPCTVMYCH